MCRGPSLSSIHEVRKRIEHLTPIIALEHTKKKCRHTMEVFQQEKAEGSWKVVDRSGRVERTRKPKIDIPTES